MIYVLNYINIAKDTINIDQRFLSMDALQAFVREQNLLWTSLGIVVLNCAA